MGESPTGSNGTPPAEQLAGGVDLGSPIIQAARSFVTELAQQRAVAAICIGLTEDGNLMLRIALPQQAGGMIMTYGMLEMAKELAGRKRQGA